MARWVKRTLTVLVLAGIVFGMAVRLATVRWANSTSSLVDKLIREALAGEGKAVTFENLDRLPAPVAKYFRLVLRESQPLVRSVRLVQTGEFLTREESNGWSPFDATQYASAQPPGFVWDASIRMAPLMKVRVRDAYVAGQGSMQGKILSLAPVMDEQGKTELNAGALQRYLAEAVWFPTALLPGAGVEWSEIDEHRALATLQDSDTTVSLEFQFNDAGEVTGIFTPERYRAVNGEYELTPWAGHFRRYEERDGMRIPLEGDVEWQLPDRNLPYWKGRIVEIEYDFAEDEG